MQIGLGLAITNNQKAGPPADVTAPTVVITLSDYALKIGDTATATFTFSEPPTGFTEADVTAPNGSLSSFTVTGDPLIYTATFTPTNGVTDATNVITVGTGWTDAAGNPPAGATNSDNYTVDTTAPTCTITCDQSSPTAISPLTFTYTWSEDVTSFAVGDAGIANGTKGTFTPVSASVYTLAVTPDAAGNVTATVAASVCIDAAGNTNAEATPLSIYALVYKLKVLFATDDDTPITNPYVGEVGSLNISDTSSKLSVSSDTLIVNGTVGSSNPEAISATGFDIAVGLTTLTRIKRNNLAGTLQIGVDKDGAVGGAAAGVVAPFFSNTRTELNVFDLAMTIDTYHTFAVVPLTNKKFVLLASGGNWTNPSVMGIMAGKDFSSTNKIYPFLGGDIGGAQIWTVDWITCSQFGTPFNAVATFATNYHASLSSGTTTTMEANAYLEATWQAVTGETIDFMFRRTDDNNCWIIRGSQAGSTVKLIQKEAGIETERVSQAQTWTNGTSYIIKVMVYGNIVSLAVDASNKSGYNSATFNNGATGVKCDKNLTEVYILPRTLSGATLTEWNRWVNP